MKIKHENLFYEALALMATTDEIKDIRNFFSFIFSKKAAYGDLEIQYTLESGNIIEITLKSITVNLTPYKIGESSLMIFAIASEFDANFSQ